MYEAEEKNMIDIVHYISNWCPQEGIYDEAKQFIKEVFDIK